MFSDDLHDKTVYSICRISGTISSSVERHEHSKVPMMVGNHKIQMGIRAEHALLSIAFLEVGSRHVVVVPHFRFVMVEFFHSVQRDMRDNVSFVNDTVGVRNQLVMGVCECFVSGSRLSESDHFEVGRAGETVRDKVVGGESSYGAAERVTTDLNI